MGALVIDGSDKARFPRAIAAGQLHRVQRFQHAIADGQIGHRSAIAMTAIIGDQPLLERILRGKLHARVDRRADRKAALLQRFLTIGLDQVAAQFLYEIGRSGIFRSAQTLRRGQRHRDGLIGLFARDILVFYHAVEHVIASRQQLFRVRVWVHRRRSLGERSQHSRF